MKKRILFLLTALLFNLPLHTQTLTIIGEYRTKDNHFLPYCEYHDATGVVINSLGDTVDVEVKMLGKESYYDTAEIGTEIIIIGEEKDIIKKRKHQDVKIQIEVSVWANSKQKTLGLFPANFHDSKIINLSNRDSINDNTIKLKDYIDLESPEKLSVFVFVDYLFRMFEKISSKEGGFSDVIKKLEIVDACNKKNKLEFVRLLNFLDYYAKDSSFLQQEALKLKGQIDSLNLVRESLVVKNPERLDEINKLQEELESLRIIDKAYESMWRKIKKYYRKLNSILSCKVTDDKIQKSRFSLALGVGGSIGDNLSVQQYSTDVIFFGGDNAGIRVSELESSSRRISPAITIMCNFSPVRRKSPFSRFGIASGISLNLIEAPEENSMGGHQNELSIGFLFGPSVKFAKERLLLSGGLSFLQVKQFNENDYNFDQNISGNQVLSFDDLTVKKLERTWFLSLSYLFPLCKG